MKMTDIEKFFVNSRWNARRRIKYARTLLGFIKLEGELDCLEVGCGNGAVSRDFALSHDARVVGIDLDLAQVKLAREDSSAIPNLTFLVADATRLPFDDNRFNIVMSFQVMHHIANWLDALGEIRRVLRPEGYFIYADIIYTEWLARLGRSFQHSYGITTMEDLNAFVRKNNFTKVHVSRRNSLMWYNFEAIYQSN